MGPVSIGEEVQRNTDGDTPSNVLLDLLKKSTIMLYVACNLAPLELNSIILYANI